MNTRIITPDIVVQEEGKTDVLIFVHLPELRVKRALRKFFKRIPSNGDLKKLQFENQSLNFSMEIEKKLYSISVARLPGEIEPDRCSIEYKRRGCWIKLKKSNSLPWMGKICDTLNPGLEKHNDDDDDDDDDLDNSQFFIPTAPMKELQLKHTDMPEPYRNVPIAPSPSVRSSTKKTRAPPPPFQDK